MKFIFFLAICVAVSHQEYRDHILMLRPWMSQFYEPSTFNDYLPLNRQGIHGDSRVNPIFKYQMNPVDNDYPSNGFAQPRVKTFVGQRRPYLSDQDEMNKRHFYINNRNNFLTRAATFTITSTCTSITYSSCVPRGNLLPAAPAAVPNCRRKREIVSQIFGEDEESQFPIVPSKVGLVLPTVLSSSTKQLLDDTREIETVDLVSSKEDGDSIGKSTEKLKVKRFFYWPNHISSTTTTSWSVVSTILTRTFVPGVNLDCLPPGYVVCPQAG